MSTPPPSPSPFSPSPEPEEPATPSPAPSLANTSESLPEPSEPLPDPSAEFLASWPDPASEPEPVANLLPPVPEPLFFHPPPLRPTPDVTDLGILVLIVIAATAILFLGTAAVAMVFKAIHPDAPMNLSRSRALTFGIPLQMLWYFLIAAICFPVFRRVWHRPFAEGIHWNGNQVASHALRYILLGVGLSLVVSIVSTGLHTPKDAPIVELFQNRTLAWIATFFGVVIAPTAEELGFRGFLLPALNSRVGAVAATVLTSALFAGMHAGQLAHAWGPVGVLFCVSVFLCIVRLRTQSVAATALLHSSYNGTIFLAMIIASGGYRHLDKLTP